MIIFGAGQVGLLVASVLRECNLEVDGFIDDNLDVTGKLVSDLPILGDRNWLARNHRGRKVCIGAGTINSRKKIAEYLDEHNISTISAIHPSVVISKEAEIQNDVVIGAGSVFYGSLSIGRGCYIGPSVTVSHDTTVGDWCLLSVGTVVGARVDLMDNVFVGTASTIMEPRFGEKARLKVDENAIIGAGSLVIRDVEKSSTVIGRPAKPLNK